MYLLRMMSHWVRQIKIPSEGGNLSRTAYFEVNFPEPYTPM